MSTSLVIYDRIADPLAAVKQFGKAIAVSGLFNLENESQGEVFALECLARRIPPLMLAQQFDVIYKKLAMKAMAMLDGFHRIGGKHKILCRTPDEAAVELSIDGEKYVFRFTWQEAQSEPFVYEGKEKEIVKLLAAGKKPELKPKYATSRARMQMLWSRVISDGIHAVRPGVALGIYTPEEVEDFDEIPSTNGHAKPKEDSDVIDASFEVTPTPTTSETKVEQSAPAVEVEEAPFDEAKPTVQVEPVNGQCSADQQGRIKELWGLLEISVDDRNKQLAKRNAGVVRNLTAEQAAELIDKLGEAYAKKQFESMPCTTGLAEQLKAKLREANQVCPGTVTKFREKMGIVGLQQIEELTCGEVTNLLAGLEGNEAEKFFGLDLWSPQKRQPKN